MQRNEPSPFRETALFISLPHDSSENTLSLTAVPELA